MYKTYDMYACLHEYYYVGYKKILSLFLQCLKKRELSPPAILQLLSVMVTSEKFFSEVKSGSQLCKSQTCDLII